MKKRMSMETVALVIASMLATLFALGGWLVGMNGFLCVLGFCGLGVLLFLCLIAIEEEARMGGMIR